MSRGNETLDDTSTTHAKAEDGTIWAPVPGVESSDFTIDFSKPKTFNGNKQGDDSYDEPDIVSYDKDGNEIGPVYLDHVSMFWVSNHYFDQDRDH